MRKRLVAIKRETLDIIISGVANSVRVSKIAMTVSLISLVIAFAVLFMHV